jgi:Zn ribbon nucleic-acid-binding protein
MIAGYFTGCPRCAAHTLAVLPAQQQHKNKKPVKCVNCGYEAWLFVHGVAKKRRHNVGGGHFATTGG